MNTSGYSEVLQCEKAVQELGVFLRPGRVITMAAPNRNMNFKKNHNYLLIFLLFGSRIKNC
jgi:hypothetical protein